MKTQTVRIQMIDNDALVQTGINTFKVTTASNKTRENSSPVELLLSSLGS